MRETVVYKKILKDLWAFLVQFISFVWFDGHFAYKIAPDNTSNANQMHLSIHSKPPGFKVKVLVNLIITLLIKVLFSGEINKTLEIPIQDYKIRSDEPKFNLMVPRQIILSLSKYQNFNHHLRI